MKKILTILCLTLGFATISQAQVYRTAAGVRLDSDRFGVSLQQKIHERGTIEGIFSVGSREYSGTALYEWHFPILGRRFNYYLGAGGHVGNLKDSGVFTGVDAILGVEYKVNGLPFLLSADVKPAVHINHEDWVDLSTGISIRYVILKEKKKKKGIWPFGNRDDDEDDSRRDRKRKKQKEEEKLDILKIFEKQEDYR